MPVERIVRRWSSRLGWSRRSLDLLTIGVILTLFAGATMLVHATGGTKLAWPYLMLVPVLLAAARFRVLGGIAGGLVGGLLLGPLMPLDVEAGVAQETHNWLVRLAFYAGLGGFTGSLFLLIRRDNEQRDRAARTDPDSGLPNKTALVEALEERSLERAEGCPLLLLVRVVDIAEIIEALGIWAVDELVRVLDRRLREQFGNPTTVYRFSMSELMLLQPDPAHTADDSAARVLQGLVESIEVRGIPVHAEIVMGSAGGGVEPCAPGELIRQARVALAEAGTAHDTHVHYGPEHERESARTLELLGRVRRGLQAGEFELHYQPKIRAADGTIAGCEGLIRWRDRGGSLIPPGRFMPRVERSALIDPLTRFVAAEATRFAQRVDTGPVSINLTPRNLLDRELVTALCRNNIAEGIAEGSLEIEITEGAIVRDPAAARAAIERLRESGFRVSVDDFGTGYSSFEYLRLLPITGLKIDRAFVIDLEGDPRAADLMATLIQIGHTLGLEVVAEGVEDEAQHEILQRLGCDLIQGFHFARPMPEDEYLGWCEGHAS